MTTIPAPRTRAAGPGRRTSRGNWELYGWMFMRASGVVLLVLIFAHLFVNLVAGEGITAIDFLTIGPRIQRLMFWIAIVVWVLLLAGFIPRQLMHVFGGE